MWLAVPILLLGMAQPGDRPMSPADVIAQAHADLERLPTSLRQDCRYLSLYNFPAAERPKWIQTLSGHCNGLSRESDITAPAIVPNTQGALLRVILTDYRWDRKTWEQLVDPYFTVATVTVVTEKWQGGIWPGDGKSYAPGSFVVSTPHNKAVLAPWLSETEKQRAALTEIALWTQSQVPVVRADWFFNQTAAGVDRKPNYYDFLGVKDEKTFQALIGFDAAKPRRKVELREAIADSGVTLQPRAIVRETAEDGGYWKSFDFRHATDKKNPLRVLGRDIEQAYDATEQYGFLPNGLWATGLFDKAGKRQDFAPDFIASDGASKSNDRRVHINVSCIRCHANGGLQNIDGWARNLLSPPLDLKSPDYAKARELRQQYYRKLDTYIAKDRLTYEESIKEATALDSKQYAKAYGDFWERYEDAKVDLARAAAELGCPPERLRTAISGKLKADQGDTVLSALVLANPRINRIPIRQWEEAYAEAQLLIRGYK